MTTLTKAQKKKVLQAKEEQIRAEDMLDLELFKAMEIMKQGTKLGIKADHSFITLYPHPTFKGNMVTGVEYKAHKAVLLPEALLERLAVLEDEIEAINTVDLGKNAKHSSEDVKKWLELREQGYSYSQIAEATGAKARTVSNYIKKYNKCNKVTVRKAHVRPTPDVVAEMVKLKEQGLTYSDIARQVGVSHPTTKKYISQYLEQKESNTEAVAN